MHAFRFGLFPFRSPLLWESIVSFSSSGYLDVSVPRVPPAWLWIHHAVVEDCSTGFPHSEISGSMDICSSPKLFAAYHVFRRLLVPRHPPCALVRLTFSGLPSLVAFSDCLYLSVCCRTCARNCVPRSWYSSNTFPSSCLQPSVCKHPAPVVCCLSVLSSLLDENIELMLMSCLSSLKQILFYRDLTFYIYSMRFSRYILLTAEQSRHIRRSLLISNHCSVIALYIYQPKGLLFLKGSGTHLLSHAVPSVVSSAVRGLTIVFGMGTGVSPGRIGTRNLYLNVLMDTHN